jgi:rhamnosyltransferase subunit B
MRAGKPQLITPFAHDQFDNAHRLSSLGIAETSQESNPSEWHRKLLRIIGDNEVRTQCDLIKSRINANPNHVERIAQAILKLA